MGRHSKYPKAAGIYKLTCIVNNKIYIGKAIDIRKRFARHKQGHKQDNSMIANAIRKHGWVSFKIEYLELFENFDKQNNQLLLDLESKYIKEYNSTEKSVGYNYCEYSSDQTGIPRSKETKEKLRLANLGKKHSLETKQLLSDITSGENHPMYGKHYDKEKLELRTGEKSCWFGKTGELHPTFGRKHSDEAKLQIKKKRANQNMTLQRLPVVQYDLITNEDIKVWEYAGAAEKELHINARCIRRVCSNNNFNKSAGGFGWRYLNPEIRL